MSDIFDLARFVEAQNPVFSRVLDELRVGRKTSHHMWFGFRSCTVSVAAKRPSASPYRVWPRLKRIFSTVCLGHGLRIVSKPFESFWKER